MRYICLRSSLSAPSEQLGVRTGRLTVVKRRAFASPCCVCACGQRLTPRSRSHSPSASIARSTSRLGRIRFGQLSKKYHPDLRPGDEDAKAKYLEISSAYDTLGSPAKR